MSRAFILSHNMRVDWGRLTNRSNSGALELLKKYRGFLFIAVVSLALCLLAPYWNEEKFPYTGTWVWQKNGHKAMESSISFSSSGACSMDYVGADRKYEQKHLACPYEMSGGSALLSYRFEAPAGNKGAPIYWLYSDYKAKLTPADEGRTLSLELLEVHSMYGDYGETWQKTFVKNKPPRILFHQLNPPSNAPLKPLRHSQ